MEREGIPPSAADRPPAAPRVVQEEEDRTSALIPTLPPVTSPPRLFLFRQTFPVIWISDRSHRTTSQNSRNQSWAVPPDVLSREMGVNVQNVRALEPVRPVNHQEPNVQRHPAEETKP